jgi:hypothetical protein
MTAILTKIKNEAKRLTPDELLHLVDELIHELLGKRSHKCEHLPWKELYGVGKGLWKNEDAQDYISTLRKDRGK